MNIPVVKPEWVTGASPIKLRFILNILGTINYAGATSNTVLKERYKNDPKLPEYLAAVDKVG